MSELAICFLGNTNTWECDEMGHMNVRFYVSKSREGLDVFASSLGLTPTWLRDKSAEMVLVDQHIRFVREFHGGQDLSIAAGVLAHSDTDFRLYQEVRHMDGAIGASVISLVELRDVVTQERLPLPDFVQSKLAKHIADISEGVGPRSVAFDGFVPGGTRSTAEEIGMVQVSLGSITQGMVDAHGFLNAEGCIGLVSDGIGHFMRGLRAPSGAKSDTGAVRAIGGAAVEYRLRYHTRPKCGDVVAVYAGLIDVGSSVFDVSHWTVNAETGAPICSSRAIALSFDLEARKAIRIPDDLRPLLQDKSLPALKSETVKD